MGTISTRVSDDLERELERFLEEEKLHRSTAVRKLLAEGLEEWRKDRALKMLEDGEISFSKAADIAGVSVWDFAVLVEEREIIWVGSDGLKDDLTAV